MSVAQTYMRESFQLHLACVSPTLKSPAGGMFLGITARQEALKKKKKPFRENFLSKMISQFSGSFSNYFLVYETKQRKEDKIPERHALNWRPPAILKE